MLNMLAMKDEENFNFFVKEDPSLVAHLIGYGLIKEYDDLRFDFRIDAIKEYLVRRNGNHPILETREEKWSHLCVQRNELETDLRKMVRSVLRIAHRNESEAKAYVIKKVFANKQSYNNKTYQELFDSRKSEIYLRSLTDLINADWGFFSDYFGKQDVFIANMGLLNKEGRFDAHGTVPEDDEINAVDNAANYLRKSIEKYKSSIG